MEIKQVFATRLKALRENMGLSQSELAAAIQVSRGSISFYENGERTADIEILSRLCEFFGVSADYLLGLEIKEFAKKNFDYLHKCPECERLTSDLVVNIADVVECMQSWHYNRYGLSNEGDTDEYVSIFNKLLFSHLGRIVSCYGEFIGRVWESVPCDQVINNYLAEIDYANDIRHKVISEYLESMGEV